MNTNTTETSWAESSPDEWIATGRHQQTLPIGVYRPITRQGHFFYRKQAIVTDELLSFDDSVFSAIVDEINSFWEKGDLFASYNFLQRRGYLFYGPPGSGKTAFTNQIIQTTIKNNGVAFMCDDPETLAQSILHFRKYEPTRKVVVLYEDIDSIIANYGENELLSCLDGQTQSNHVLNIATTNYPEKLDRRIFNRPRRFDQIIKIGFPSKEIRKQYFIFKLKISESEVESWLDHSEGFSFSACADLVINVKILGNSLIDSAKTVRHTMTVVANSSDFKDGNEN